MILVNGKMIHHRQQLINWLLKNVTDRVILNAIESGRIENYGGFNPLPTTNFPGWVVAVTSVRNKTYNIAIVADINFTMRWFRIKDVPWSDWVGDTATSKVHQGDNPEKYQELKNASTKTNKY